MRLTSYRLANAALTLLCAAAGLYAAARWLLPWAAPFLLACAAAVLLEPAVAGRCRRGVPRALAAGLCLLGTLAAVWVLIGLVYGYSALKRRRERHKKFT